MTTSKRVCLSPCEGKGSRRSGGFTLIELLCVIAIMGILAAICGPSIASVAAGDRLTNNIYELSGLLQQSRAAAMAQHTYVWLGFYSYTQDGSPALMVASILPNSGILAANGIQTDIANNQFRTSTQRVVIKNAKLADVSNYSALPGLDVANNTDAGSQAYSFQLNVPENSSASFGEVIVFGPDGEVNLPQEDGTLKVTQCVGIGLTAAPGSGNRTHSAAIQIHGLSGQVSIFQQ